MKSESPFLRACSGYGVPVVAYGAGGEVIYSRGGLGKSGLQCAENGLPLGSGVHWEEFGSNMARIGPANGSTQTRVWLDFGSTSARPRLGYLVSHCLCERITCMGGEGGYYWAGAMDNSFSSYLQTEGT